MFLNPGTWKFQYFSSGFLVLSATTFPSLPLTKRGHFSNSRYTLWCWSEKFQPVPTEKKNNARRNRKPFRLIFPHFFKWQTQISVDCQEPSQKLSRRKCVLKITPATTTGCVLRTPGAYPASHHSSEESSCWAEKLYDPSTDTRSRNGNIDRTRPAAATRDMFIINYF